MTHDTTITEMPSGRYWWDCTCGDEAGPFEFYEHAWDSTVEHERKGKKA